MNEFPRRVIRCIKQASIIGSLVVFLVLPYSAIAYEITTVDVDVRNDFILEQSRASLALDPGETVTEYISVINRYPEEKEFILEFESFLGTRDVEAGPGGALQFVEIDESHPHSLVQYIEPEITSFSLGFGEKIRIPVTISIPPDAEPGGRYGAVVVSDEPSVRRESQGTGVTTISRAAFLFLVQVNGDIVQNGSLVDFHIEPNRKVYFRPQPVTFSIVFENTGNVHLAPSGDITIENMTGSVIDQFPVLPYFVLPDSIRVRNITWENSALQFGRYTASLELNSGYDNQTDAAVVSYWFIPIKLIAIVLGGLFILILLIAFFLRNFKIQKK